MLYEGVWQPVVASLLVAALLVGVLWPVVAHAELLAWFIAMLVVSLIRLDCGRRYRRLPPDEQARPCWLRLAAVGALVSGALWGAASLALFPHQYLQYQLALVLTIAGVGAAGVTTLASVWWVAALFLVPLIAPLALQYAWVGSGPAWKLATMVALFLAFVLVASYRLSRVLHENIRLKVEMGARERDLRESESRYRAIFHASPLGVFHFDRDGRLIDCNDKLLEFMGATRERVIGLDLFGTLEDARFIRGISQALSVGQGYFEGDYTSVLTRVSRPLRVLFSGIRDSRGEITGGVAVVEDLTEHRQAEATIHRQAFYDPLTALPNRRLLLDRIDQTRVRCRARGERGALLFVDLDRFKKVNESLGHAAGDQILTVAAQRLVALLRDDDLAARVSGDEFVVMIPSLRHDDDQAGAAVRRVAERIMQALSVPYRIAERSLKITPSIGFVLFGDDETSAVDLIKQAETAMYQAKAEGRARACHYLPSMHVVALQRLTLEQDLRQALENPGQLELHYQPQVDSDGHIIGAEALLRWHHPKRGMVSPAEFIPVAEESGLILELGDWVLVRACETLQRLDARCLPRLSINISPRQFGQANFIEAVESCVSRSGIDPARLQLEITEGVLIDDLFETIETMRILKGIGVGLAIDDFGVGYSSLSYLKRLPLDELKIDRSFIQELDDSNDAAIVQAIIAVAGHLHLSVVAEGIETAEQQAFLETHGCHCFQGFRFFRPMPYAALLEVFEERRHAHSNR
ncbi:MULTISPECIES: EAL domain-containing protein [Modicisalibacter]|uniref:putative bifunctional diguanylate cyclase/phosphodiesterase n=1 Tax=Modicisalibacter TaxID=574347 RepID=UPI00100B7C32|nr:MULTISPECIES: EAL domain-containing protein [Halomonadaceae]MBZ9559765.1 EAL domain-containing protein [Modicisalibacter sp. R2A 31.J]MBZ9577217.1 EAL domain-containing protein [Modicisalibacter sp. MOD 31.J]